MHTIKTVRAISQQMPMYQHSTHVQTNSDATNNSIYVSLLFSTPKRRDNTYSCALEMNVVLLL